MSYYMYEKPRKTTFTWIKIMVVVIITVALVTGMLVAHQSSSKIAELNKTIKQMQEKEVYYKGIEQQFFEKKAEGVVNQRYEEQLKQKDEEKEKEVSLREQQITTLSDYVEELSSQSAALENTIRNVVSTSDVLPRNFIMPEKVSRGSYDRARRTEDNKLVETKMEYVGSWLMTMYAPTAAECGNNKGITASGKPVQPGQNIAIDPRYWKFGQKFYVEGYGEVVATDTGGAIKGRNRLDYCVLDPDIAKKFGSKRVRVWLIK